MEIKMTDKYKHVFHNAANRFAVVDIEKDACIKMFDQEKDAKKYSDKKNNKEQINEKKHEIKFYFENKEDEESFKELLQHVIGISIDGKKETSADNYGQFQYISNSIDEVLIKSH
jgi:hypothetical protein